MGADNQAQRVLDGKLARALRTVLTEFSEDERTGTPDWILANYMLTCLHAFEIAVRERDRVLNGEILNSDDLMTDEDKALFERTKAFVAEVGLEMTEPNRVYMVARIFRQMKKTRDSSR